MGLGKASKAIAVRAEGGKTRRERARAGLPRDKKRLLSGFDEPSRARLLVEHRRQHALRGDLLARAEQGRVALNVRGRIQRARDQNHNCGEDGNDSPHGHESHQDPFGACRRNP